MRADLMRVPGDPQYGTWTPFTWDDHGTEREGIDLVPDQAPWHALFAALDDAGASLTDEPVSLIDEAEAIVACCWRYGSYAHVLTAGERFLPFQEDETLSRITDSEMMRINLEFSSGVAEWLTVRDAEPSRVYRRVRAAQLWLPMPWRNRRVYRDIAPDYQDLEERIAILLPEADHLLSQADLSTREEANRAVLGCYRNGIVEHYHAGHWSLGTEIPGMKRLYADEVARICRQATLRFERHLAVRIQLSQQSFKAFLWGTTLGSTSGWSLSEETAQARFYGEGFHQSLEERVRWLAVRFPTLYVGTLPQPVRSAT